MATLIKPYSAFGISTETAYVIKDGIALDADVPGTQASLEYIQTASQVLSSRSLLMNGCPGLLILDVFLPDCLPNPHALCLDSSLV